jgi:hypothetical protein
MTDAKRIALIRIPLFVMISSWASFETGNMRRRQPNHLDENQLCPILDVDLTYLNVHALSRRRPTVCPCTFIQARFLGGF